MPEAAGGINATEAADGVPVLVTLPAGAVAGDVITVSIDGSTPITHTVTAAEAAAPATPISVLLPAADITAAGQRPATITPAITTAHHVVFIVFPDFVRLFPGANHAPV